MQNGFCFRNCLIGMQISADIHSPKNKTGNKHPQADSDNIYLGEEPFTIVDMGKGKRTRNQGIQILSPPI